MASRPSWKGHLKLSLVSCPVALYNAATASEKIAFHLLNRSTGNRLRRLLVDGETGETVETADQIRGYEVSKGDYIEIEGDDLDALALESTHTIDIDGFVERRAVNDVYIDSPYYLVPDGRIGEEAFAVIREAMAKRGVAGLGRVVLNRRERVVMLEPHARGIVATTLRYAYEIKPEAEFFGAIPDLHLPKEMLDLADHIIERKRTDFDPSRFEDRYETAMRDLIASRQQGRPQKPNRAPPPPSNVVDLMEALRRSVAGASSAARSASSPKPTATAKSGAAPASAPSPKSRSAPDSASPAGPAGRPARAAKGDESAAAGERPRAAKPPGKAAPSPAALAKRAADELSGARRGKIARAKPRAAEAPASDTAGERGRRRAG